MANTDNIHHFIIATAGHVDHGKSALVKALTGTDPDRLPEEKERGITIDLGFAHLELTVPDADSGPELSVGVVDVPGHEDFVKNMVAGVGSIDLALFIVAADDGWMPQTEEHLQILNYLGVTRAVLALTKIDLLESDPMRAAAVDGIREQLRASPFTDSPIVPVSVITGEGLENLKQTLARTLAQTPPPRDLGKPRLSVDRVFTLRGIGTVVTGTLNGGTLRRGQNVVVQPAGLATRLRSLQSHNRDVDASHPGTRTALNLPDVANRTDASEPSVKRGDVVTLPELGGPSDTLDVAVEKSTRLRDTKTPAARPLKDGTRVNIHHGSGHVAGRLLFIDADALAPGDRALAQLRCEAPVFAFAGDHFILRDWSEQLTLAGGVILDPDASRKGFRNEPHRRFLEERAQALTQASAFVHSQIIRDGAVRRAHLIQKSRFSEDEVAEALAHLTARAEIVSAGDFLAGHAYWQRLKAKAAEAIDSEHRARPQNPGLALNELRHVVGQELSAPELFDALIADLCLKDFVQTGVVIRRAHFRPALPPQLQAAGARLRSVLSAKPFEPPSRKELAPDVTSQQALKFLLQTNEAVELGDEVVLLTENFIRATETIRHFLRAHRSATVSELRQAVGASRRIVVPLLERLDRDGVTRREGDKRVLRQQ